jgi:hypothetical protein
MGAPVKSRIFGLLTLLAWQGAAGAQTGQCLAIPLTTPITYVGEFTNMRHTAEHSYGFEVTLWRAGDCLIGILASAGGLSGDTPIGVIQDATYDRTSGRLSFAAKLTTGVTSPRGSSVWEPARDFYSFIGVLSATRLIGAMTHDQRNHPHIPPTTTDVTLSMAKADDTATARVATSYGQWQQAWKPILAVRGPKW